MPNKKIYQTLARMFAAIAAVSLIVALTEGFVQLFGASIVSNYYSPGRLLDLAATLMIFAIALLLHQILEELRKES